MERTTVRLPAELLSRARKKALAERRTLTSLIEQGLRSVVDERRMPAKGERRLPRVSSATGGLNPGFTWENLSREVQEMEDLEDLERMKRF